jgi:hypothetical protein
MTEIPFEGLPPEPSDTGVAPEQKATPLADSQALIPSQLGGGLEAIPLSSAIREVIEGGVRGQAAMVLLLSSTRHLEKDLNDARQEGKDARHEASRWREEFYSQRQRVAVLEERVTNAMNIAPLQSLLMTIGGVVLGVAVPFLEKSLGWSVAGIALGAVLLMGGWRLRFKGKEES